jgi:glycosyltransferase involved in cell wall biosynthesis
MTETQKKKLLVASDSTLPRLDGVSVFLMNTIPRMKDSFDVTIIAPKFKVKEVNDKIIDEYFSGINNVYTKLSPFKVGDFPLPSFAFGEVKKQVRENDIVFVHSIGPIGLAAIHYAKKFRKPIIAYVHSIEFDLWRKSVKLPLFIKIFIRKIAKSLMMYAYRRCTHLLAPSDEVKELLENEKLETKISVVPVGIDVLRFVPPEDKEKAKAKIKIPKNKIVMGYVGRLGREKDLPTLISAFEHLEKKYKNLLLIFIGTGLENELKKKSSLKNIYYLGLKEDVVPYLQAMDIFVLPSLTETSSISTIEAMSTGLPVVVTPVGILKEIIEKEKNGFLFPKGSVDSLVQILDRLISDENLRKTAGRNARITIKNHFSWAKTSRKIKDILLDL